VIRPHLARQAAAGKSGVAAVGVAQEFARVWTAYEGVRSTGAPRWSFVKADRRVTCYYFYLWADDYGRGSSKSARTSPNYITGVPVSADPGVFDGGGVRHVYVRGTANNLLEFIPDNAGGLIWNAYDQTATTRVPGQR